ncbi:MAG: hypothetical protein LCH59_00810 [Proteobacteria bacterium]|nr:hypothetical protein [Pseudomonadota bacterium]
MQAQTYTPTIRAALLAALDTPTRTLRRCQNGFIAVGSRSITTSAPKLFQAFTKRAVNQLEREGLARLDDPDSPSTATLTDAGVAAAEQLKAQQQGKAVRS